MACQRVQGPTLLLYLRLANIVIILCFYYTCAKSYSSILMQHNFIMGNIVIDLGLMQAPSVDKPKITTVPA